MLKNGAKGLNSSKWLLLACAVSAAVVDIIIIAMLIAGGEGGEYLACPFLLLIFDAFYLAVSLFFTNFRFKYSIGVWVSYIVLYTVGFLIGLSIILGGDGTVITNGALALWACVHAFNIVCAVVCALFASRVIKKTWLALAFAVVFIGGAIAYAGFMFADGFFGQGRSNRTLVYKLNTSGGYTVTDVLAGRSDTVNVPATFNGKPVNVVSLNVLANGSVKNYSLPADIAFDDLDALKRGKIEGKNIKVDKKSVNETRGKFLSFAQTHDENLCRNALALANATLPVNLAENEGYVAFNYQSDGFKGVGYNTIPVYVGDLESFDIGTYTAGYNYVEHREDGTADNYYWAHRRSGGYILTDIADESGSLFDGVTKSTVADVKFERVYRIKVDNGNDNKYPMREKQPELCFDTVGGVSEYKYLTGTMASTFLDSLTPRAGFTYRWACNAKPFTDLTELLEDEGDDITISTRWELNKPTVTVGTSATDNTITYGDDVTLLSAVEHEADGIRTEYAWFYKDDTQASWSTENVSLTRPRPSERAGVYTLWVQVGGDEITSLGAFAEVSVELKINRKQVTFDWHLPENRVYDGTLKEVSVSLDESQQVEGNPLNYNLPGLKSFKDAGTYNFTIVTNAITNLDYQITNPKNSVTIQPCPVAVDWANYENLEYNGLSQCPLATAYGIPADGMLALSVSGGNKNAGSYTATATTSNPNYTLTGANRPYTIAKKSLTITADSVIVAYGKTEPKTVALSASQCQGFVEGEGVSSLGGAAWISYEGKNVGTYEHGVKIWGLTSNNYEISYVYGQLQIGARAVQLEWSGADNLVYDGNSKNVTAVAVNKGYDDDDIRVIITNGDAIYAGEHTAVAEIDPTCEDAGNYSFTYTPANNRQLTYTIGKRSATIVWHVPANPVYDGNEHEVSYVVQNIVAGDKQHFTDSFKYENAGDYSFEVVGDQFVLDNYTLNNSTVSFTVKSAAGAVEFFVNNISYDDYDTAVRVGDKISWRGNSVIWSSTVYRNGEADLQLSPLVLIYTEFGEYEIKAAGDYVFEIDVGGYDDNTTRRTVTFKISGVLEREEVEVEKN